MLHEAWGHGGEQSRQSPGTDVPAGGKSSSRRWYRPVEVGGGGFWCRPRGTRWGSRGGAGRRPSRASGSRQSEGEGPSADGGVGGGVDGWVSDKQGSCGRSQELNGGPGKRRCWARHIACEQGRFLGPSPEPLNQNLHLDKVLGEARARRNGTRLVLNPLGQLLRCRTSQGLHSAVRITNPPERAKVKRFPDGFDRATRDPVHLR